MARFYTVDGTVVKNISIHNHVPDAAKIEARKAISESNIGEANTQESTHQIVATVSAGVTAAASGQLTSDPAIKQTICRARRQQQIKLTTPTCFRISSYLIHIKLLLVEKTSSCLILFGLWSWAK